MKSPYLLLPDIVIVWGDKVNIFCMYCIFIYICNLDILFEIIACVYNYTVYIHEFCLPYGKLGSELTFLKLFSKKNSTAGHF